MKSTFCEHLMLNFTSCSWMFGSRTCNLNRMPRAIYTFVKFGRTTEVCSNNGKLANRLRHPKKTREFIPLLQVGAVPDLRGAQAPSNSFLNFLVLHETSPIQLISEFLRAARGKPHPTHFRISSCCTRKRIPKSSWARFGPKSLILQSKRPAWSIFRGGAELTSGAALRANISHTGVILRFPRESSLICG